MCIASMLLGKAIGGRTGAILGTALGGGGILPTLGVAALTNKPKPQPSPAGGFGG